MNSCYRLISGLLKAAILHKRVPLLVAWSITNRCNINCMYCRRRSSAFEELNTNEVKNIISELSSMNTYMINFTGGEPLIRDDLGEIIESALKNCIRVNISSNGLLVPDKIGILRNVNTLALSLDGPEQVHDKLRCTGSYKAVLKAASAASENGIKLVFSPVITRINVNSLDYILGKAGQFNAKVFFSVVEDIPDLYPDKQNYAGAISYLIDQKAKGNKNIGNSMRGVKYLGQWPDFKEDLRCAAGRIMCAIEDNGDLYGCRNVAWNSESQTNSKNTEFKKAFSRIPVNYKCSSCWCGTRIDTNLILSMKPDVVWEYLKFFL